MAPRRCWTLSRWLVLLVLVATSKCIPVDSTSSCTTGTTISDCTCGSGYYVAPLNGSLAQCNPCSLCAAGSACSNQSCTACPPGTYSNAGDTSCTSCSPGTSSLTGSAGCTYCPANSFNDQYGALCVPCPAYSSSQSAAGGCTCNIGYSSSGYGSSLTCLRQFYYGLYWQQAVLDQSICFGPPDFIYAVPSSF